MSIFENPVIISDEEAAAIQPEDLLGFGQKFDGIWYFVSYVNRDDKIIIVSMSTHKSYKKAMKEAMRNGIQRVSK